MTTTHQIKNHDSPVKQELDRLELVECVPALQRGVADVKGHELVLILPSHPAVSAYVTELAALPRETTSDLKHARQMLKSAQVNYKNRVAFRLRRDIGWSDGGLFVSLSAILEARADGLHWWKIVKRLAREAREARQRVETEAKRERKAAGIAVWSKRHSVWSV